MAKDNRVCCVCGNSYYYCINDCIDSINKPTWLGSFCCENCRNIYNACAFYNINQMSKDEAKNILEKCDISNIESFTDATKKLINEILKNDEVVSKQSNIEDKSLKFKPKENNSKINNTNNKKYNNKK